jgi:hypothetical protein
MPSPGIRATFAGQALWNSPYQVYAITAGWAAWVKRTPRADLPEGPLRLGYETFALKIECDTD